jgi:diaminobutyrate-2-oxoglutarate transaminase
MERQPVGVCRCYGCIEYFRDNDMENMVAKKEAIIKNFLEKEILPIDNRLSVRGIGMIWGIDFSKIDSALSKKAMQECVKNGLIIERAGSFDCVLKILPPLTIPEEVLMEGLKIIKQAVTKTLDK